MAKFHELIFILGLILQISANQVEQQKFHKCKDKRNQTYTLVSGKKNCTKTRPIPAFSRTYIAEGVIIVPNTTIKQPIQVWYDGDEGIHRIDYYNGIFTTLRVQRKNEIRAFDYFPVSTETFKNQFHCNISTFQGSRLDDFLPQLSKHRYCGKETLQGVKTEKWCFTTNVQKETVYVQFKKSTNSSQKRISAPVMIKREANRYAQQIHFTKFIDSKPDTKFMTEPLRKKLNCTKMTEFEEYTQELGTNTVLIYGEHQAYFTLQPDDYKNLPDTFDWRDYGAVSEVKDQGEDGPCWSFAATAVIESAHLIRTNGTQKFDFSEQALLDCAWGFGSSGHFGGDQRSAFQWVIKQGGIPTEEQYGPYLAKSGYCHTDKVNLTPSISEWGQIEAVGGNRSVVKAALKRYGPLAVIMDAYADSFVNYSKSDGIYSDPACKTEFEGMNHVAVLVGYGKKNETEYWIIKNSWGTNWGNQGYAYVAIDHNEMPLNFEGVVKSKVNGRYFAGEDV